MALRSGALLIGSLFWDKSKQRCNWRDSRLKMIEEETVFAPIRYGRLSSKRGNTYTMVFSRLCLWKNHGLGMAKVIPFKQPVCTIEQLVEEAELLWAAERDEPTLNGKISAHWGCVALLVNPDSQVPSNLLDNWKKRVAGDKGYGNLDHTNREGPIVTVDGLLNFPWPKLAKKDASLQIDVILATANKPTLRGNPPTYARVREIARAWSRDHANYFWQNRENGIHTYQDEAIIRLIRG